MLAGQGWHVIAHGRDAGHSGEALAELRAAASPEARVDMVRCDLALLSDTARMADEITGLTECTTLSRDWQSIAAVLETGSWVATLHDRGTVIVEVELESADGRNFVLAGVHVLIDLEFDNRQPAVTVNSEQIDDSAIAARELRYLTVDRLGAQRRIQRFQIGTHPRFEPRFGLSWTRRAGLFSAGIQPGVEVSVIPRVNQLLIPGAIVYENHIASGARV